MKVKQEFIVSMSFDKYHLIKHKCTILSGDKKGKVFYKETITPKTDYFQSGKEEYLFYTDPDNPFEKLEDLIKQL